MVKVSGPGRRSLLIGAAAAGAAVAAARVVAAKTRAPLEGPWAIELFTSQGCSSCPPADAYLGVLAKRPDIVALSFHVDYWDYIGWKDAFATRATPEFSRTEDGTLTVKLAAFPLDGGPADVTLAIYDRRHSTPVASGENQGRMLDNFNIVRRLQTLSRWDGAAASWTIADAGLQPGLGAAVLVQRADHGPVIGCNKLEPMV